MVEEVQIFFDFDGVIIDSRPGVELCINEILVRWSEIELTKDEKVGLIGPPLDQALIPVFENRSIPESRIRDFVTQFRELYWLTIDQTPLMQGMSDVLFDLANFASLSIVTSKPIDQTTRILEVHGLKELFGLITGSTLSAGSNKTDLLNLTIKKLQIKSVSNAWMIGDRIHDVQAAKANNIKSIGITWGYGSVTELKESGCDFIVHRPKDLKRVVFN